jgi:hypothetical protein
MSLKSDLNEIAFCGHLDELYGEDITQGVTTTTQRRDRARNLITRMGAADRLVGRKQTLGQAFERVWGEPLVTGAWIIDRHENGDGV